MTKSRQSKRNKSLRAADLIRQFLKGNDRPILLLEDRGCGVSAVLHGEVFDVTKMLFMLLAEHPELESIVVPGLIQRRRKCKSFHLARRP